MVPDVTPLADHPNMEAQKFNKEKAQAIATELALLFLLSEKERFRDRLTDDSRIGRGLAGMFGDSDEEQESYNQAISMCMDEFDTIINEMTEKLLALVRI